MKRTTETHSKGTPRSAVLQFCRECIGNGNLQECDAQNCPFHMYIKRKGQPDLSKIRKKCLECMGGSSIFVEECGMETCPLYIYRLGTNPNRTGIGGGVR